MRRATSSWDREPHRLRPFADTLVGDAGGNVLRGEGGDDALWGNDGDDTLEGGAGADRFTGRAASTGPATRGPRPGSRCASGPGTASGGDATGDTLAGSRTCAAATMPTRWSGTAAQPFPRRRGDDDIWANDGDDTLEGGPGSDILRGQGGSDTASYAGSPRASPSALGR
jgi:Ca2+-binding RTX toxin-like protein